MSRSPNFEYYPGPVPTAPEAMTEYLANELYQISLALRPDLVGLTVRNIGTAAINPTENWQNLFTGTPAERVNPADSWDSVSGAFTVSQSGLYSLNASLTVSPFGLGNKQYYVGIRALVDGVVGVTRVTGGDDAMPLSVPLAAEVELESGQVLTLEGTAVHDSFAGTVNFDAYWTLGRIG